MLGKDLGESKLGSQLKHLRELDLDQMEKPKTLVILHYCGKRISVPLFQEVANLAQLLYHHIAKLEQAILSNEPAWEKNSKAQIVCFEIKKDGREFRPEKEQDGDLRSDVLLSLLRIESKVGEDSAEELAFRLDVTKVYKYLEIQPFYRYFQQELSHVYQRDKLASNDFPYFHFHRLLSQSKLSSTFLARRISNGHFYSVKVYCSGAKTGIEDHKTIEHMQNIDELRKDSEIKSSLLVKTHQVALIPHPEAEDEQSDDEMTCKYIALASPFFVRGTLEEMLKDARYNRSKRILEMDCLNYLKELMWGAHLLHEKYNIVHRAIVPANLWIDQNGQLRLTSYYSCIPCYDANGHYASYQHKSRGSSYYSRVDFQQIFEEGEYDLGEFTPPEVSKGQPYNYLVDFYTIGVIIRKLYELSQAYERVPVSQNNENLMMTMINRLTSPDLREREAIVLEIIEDIERENLQGNNQQVLGLSNLVLQDIKLGRPIELSQSKKFIESEQSYNGVDLQVITAYFRKPKAKPLLKPAGKKITRNVSKEKLSVKNSREKSQKSMSKTSELQAARKVSKKKMGSISKDSQTSQSRESKLTQVRKEIESPSHKKPSKSKSHEKKKKQEQNQSLKLKHGQQDHKIKQSSAPVVPKSPKANTLPRNPLQVREKLK